MKTMVKKLMRSLWRFSGPVRRPLIGRIDRHAMGLLQQLPLPPGPPADLDLLLNSVVRELARLRAQVEQLQEQIDDLQSTARDAARPEGPLAVVGEVG